MRIPLEFPPLAKRQGKRGEMRKGGYSYCGISLVFWDAFYYSLYSL